MIGLTILIIGIAGILSMQVTQLHATSYTRHAGEAAILGERKLEQLRTQPVDPVCTSIAPCTETQDARGSTSAADEPFTLSWYFTGTRPVAITVTSSWVEREKDTHTLTFNSKRYE